jgi:hypothetical protein
MGYSIVTTSNLVLSTHLFLGHFNSKQPACELLVEELLQNFGDMSSA